MSVSKIPFSRDMVNIFWMEEKKNKWILPILKYMRFWQPQKVKEWGHLSFLVQPTLASLGYEALLMTDFALLYYGDPFSWSKLHNIQIAM